MCLMSSLLFHQLVLFHIQRSYQRMQTSKFKLQTDEESKDIRQKIITLFYMKCSLFSDWLFAAFEEKKQQNTSVVMNVSYGPRCSEIVADHPHKM